MYYSTPPLHPECNKPIPRSVKLKQSKSFNPKVPHQPDRADSPLPQVACPWFNIFLLMHTTICALQSYPGLNLPLLKQHTSLMKYSRTRSEHHSAPQRISFTHGICGIVAHLCKGFYLMQNNGLITEFHQRLGSRESERSQPCTKSSN